MKFAIVILSFLGLTAAAPSREKRQTYGCPNAFQNVPNVCKTNPSGTVFFPHPSDATKFLQCDLYKRMYIIQCPQGTVFDLKIQGCEPPTTLTAQPPYQQPTTAPRVPPTLWPFYTQAPPQTQQPQTQQPGGYQPPNTMAVCTAQNVARGEIYFEVKGDKTKFIECDPNGNAQVISCPNLLEWDQNILSCVYPMNMGQNSNQPRPTPNIPSGQTNNPCSQSALSQNQYYFPHPDQSKFIQCDQWGDAFDMNCPAKMRWHAILLTCYRPFVQYGTSI